MSHSMGHDRSDPNVRLKCPAEQRMTQRLTSFWQDDSGATSIEYALIGAIVSIVIIASLMSANSVLEGLFTKVVNAF